VVEEFSISDEEVAKLTEEIKRVASEILELKFWNTRCNDKECKYCAIRDVAV
jgi:hypothetical protein